MKSKPINRLRFASLILFAAVTICGTSALPAQVPEDDLLDFMQLTVADLRNASRNIISGVMKFTDEEANVFWPVYDKFDREYNKISDQMEAVIKDYEAHYKTMDDSKARELAQRMFAVDEAKVRLQENYYNEFSKVISANRTTQLFQVLRRIDLLMNLKIAATLPVIGEE
ncbi:MAG: hypothetical protein P8Z37_14230 [Acidobacteriota bacterium]